jgi:hypothetical protein
VALTIQSPGTLAVSAQAGTSISVAYPASAAEGEKLILILGMKPSTANSGSVTTPAGWTLVGSLTAAGGYGTTLGADTGNTNLFVYERTVPAGGLSGSLTVSVATNNVCWAQMERITSSNGAWHSVAMASGSDITDDASVSVACGSNPGVTAGDAIFTAFCCPTDAITGFSAYGATQSGVTFGTWTQRAYADSGTGNDIGGFIASCLVSSGAATGNPTVTATAAGTLTNVRGPGIFVRVRETADTVDDLTATGIAAGSPVVGGPALGQKHALTATAIAAGSPVLGNPAISQTQVLVATALATGAPVLGNPALTQRVTHTLTATALATGSPVLGNPAISQTQVLAATALATGSPVLGAPAVGQKHALTATAIAAGAPVLGNPVLVHVAGVHTLTATNLAAGAPVLGTPVLAHKYNLAATALATGAPALGNPAVGQKHTLTATALATGSPVLGTPAISQANVLTATAIAAGAPVLGNPAVGQKHTLTATALATGSPVLGTPVLAHMAGVHALTATALATGSPVLGNPALAHKYNLTATAIAAGAPVLGHPAVGQKHTLTAAAIAAGAPTLGTPSLSQAFALVALGLVAGAPRLWFALPGGEEFFRGLCFPRGAEAGAPLA